MAVVFKDLWRGHPINESVMAPCVADDAFTNLEGKVVERGYPVYGNQCAIRMGVALRRAGVTYQMLGRTATCGHHPKDEMHIINASQLAIAIKAANLPGFAPVEVIGGADAAQFYPKLFGRTGVIFVKDYWHRSTDRQDSPTGDHIDVWNGYRSSAKMLMEWFFWLGYYSNYAGAKELWFWEVE
ncbi:MAG: T6SS effector amidase Tae4 family protein [Hyphomicrobiaceae bacterium]|nr:T6SS effector amidase Tae4 family protein [Hyphomicrobiaceae bacterium]